MPFPWENRLIGGVERRRIEIVPYNPSWRDQFEGHAERLRGALGSRALQIEHVGSTSVPGLAAKPIIDIVVVVNDSSEEDRYVPELTAAGYELRVREPEWNEHRMFRTPERDVHIHVYSLGCREVERVLLFRDRLRCCDQDRADYEQVKRELAAKDWEDMNAYARAKSEIIERILRSSSCAPIL